MPLDFVAGLAGGITGVLVGHPFDTVKVRLQTQTTTINSSGIFYNGTWHCFKEIAYRESIFGLYKGISSPLAGLAFINAIVFGVYGNTLKHFSKLCGQDTLSSYFCAGVSSGLVQSLICSPMEMAKLRLQLQGKGVWAKHIFFYLDPPLRYAGPLDCLRQVYASNGLKGVFRGLPLTLCRDGPSVGIYFSSYEFITRKMVQNSGGRTESLSTCNLLLAGGFAGMLSWLFLYPVDVVKSRYQADYEGTYKTVWDCVLKSYRSDGWRVFIQGLCPTLLRAFPTNAVTFLTVEWVYRLANGYLPNNVQSVAEKSSTFSTDSSNPTISKQNFIEIPMLNVHYACASEFHTPVCLSYSFKLDVKSGLCIL